MAEVKILPNYIDCQRTRSEPWKSKRKKPAARVILNIPTALKYVVRDIARFARTGNGRIHLFKKEVFRISENRVTHCSGFLHDTLNSTRRDQPSHDGKRWTRHPHASQPAWKAFRPSAFVEVESYERKPPGEILPPYLTRLMVVSSMSLPVVMDLELAL